MPRKSTVPSAHGNLAAIDTHNIKDGMVTTRRGLNLKSTEAENVMNMRYIRSALGVCVESREGLKLQTSTSGAGSSIKDIGHYVDSGATTHTLLVANSKLWSVDTSSGTTTEIGNLDGTRGRGCQFKDKWIIADGGYLKEYDGTSITLCYDDEGFLEDTTSLTNNGHHNLYSGANTVVGQHVTTDAWSSFSYTISVSSATFYLSKTGSPNGSAYAKIYNASGSAVATSDALDVSTLTSAAAATDFTFSTTYAAAPNTGYYFGVNYTSGSASAHLNIYYSTATSGDGVLAYYDGSWHDDATKDCLYKIAPGLPPKTSFAVEHYNRLFCNDENDINRLRYCNVRDENDWSAAAGAGSFYIEAGTKITAIKQFYNTLIIFMGAGQKRVLRLTGTSPSDFAMNPLMVGVTSVNQDVVHHVGNDLVFLDNRGVVSLLAWENYGDLEHATQSRQVDNLVLQNVSTSRFAGVNPTDQQYWLDVGSTNHILVYDVEYRIWSKYWFELGTSVTPTCFGEFNGEAYVGDSAGHLWKLDQLTPQYKDNTTDYSMSILYAPTRVDSFNKKHCRYVNANARTRTGGNYDIVLYKDLSRDSLHSIDVSVPFDPDLTVDEATMTVDEALWTIDDVAGNLYLNPVNFEFTEVQIGIENIEVTGNPMIVQGVELHAALLSRR